MKFFRYVVVVSIVGGVLSGCTKVSDAPVGSTSTGPTTSSVDTTTSDLQLVQRVFAELLKIEPQAVRPDATLAQLNADDLDIVEAVMEVEDKLGIRIPDDAITNAGGSKSPIELPNRLTVRQFAAVVTAVRKRPEP